MILDIKIVLNKFEQRAYLDLFKTLPHQLMSAQIRVNRLEIDTSKVETA